MKTLMFDLVLDTGEIISCECDQRFSDEVLEDVRNAMKRGDRWGVKAYDGTTAKFLGHHMDSVNMARVVGML